ncbi:hypothetical protein H4219_001301 [Mycoemilia scoparia]|uniref:Uncharacterized protein n=1 Tax=Mycoemilia scoparia TaxID=417184 RepID=A0A9W8DVJ8_9FUNG|nr:hypothetical protein H4219_001301 [Mycoemilia scoparia]
MKPSYDQDDQAIKTIQPEKFDSFSPEVTTHSSKKLCNSFVPNCEAMLSLIMDSLNMGLDRNANIHNYGEEITNYREYQHIYGEEIWMHHKKILDEYNKTKSEALKSEVNQYPTVLLEISEAFILPVLEIKEKANGSYSNVTVMVLVVCLRNLQKAACCLREEAIIPKQENDAKDNVDLRNEIYNCLIEEFMLIIGCIGTQEVEAKHQHGAETLIFYFAEIFGVRRHEESYLLNPEHEEYNGVIDKIIHSDFLKTFYGMSNYDYMETSAIRLMVDNEVISFVPNHIAVYDFFIKRRLDN